MSGGMDIEQDRGLASVLSATGVLGWASWVNTGWLHDWVGVFGGVENPEAVDRFTTRCLLRRPYWWWRCRYSGPIKWWVVLRKRDRITHTWEPTASFTTKPPSNTFREHSHFTFIHLTCRTISLASAYKYPLYHKLGSNLKSKLYVGLIHCQILHFIPKVNIFAKTNTILFRNSFN